MHDNLAIDLSKFLNMPIEDKSNGIPLQTIFPLTEMLSNQFFSPQAMSEKLLTKVEYTNSKEKLYPRLLGDNGNQTFIALGKLGKYKNLHWTFQNEWRYIFTALSLPFNQILNGSFTDSDFQAIADRLISGSEKQPFPHYDMIISNEAFLGMEVTLSPRISAGNRTIVETFMNVYNSSARISCSSLDGLI